MDENEIPALGRPFELGMLYDIRTNNIITNRRIWEEKSIKLHTVSQPQPQCDFDFTTEDTISAKTSFLDINADLKLSVLFGLVGVNGSAKYLENHRRFTRQSRVSLKYRCRTHFKELEIKTIMSERQVDRSALNYGTASHIVSGILYGIDAIFIFDRNATDDEDERQIHKKLEAMVKFLPKTSVASNIDEGKLLNDVKFTYHGDIPLDCEPTSFEEAVNIYKTLPSKIGHKGENCVPMTVWLYPLHKLTGKTLTLNRHLLDVTVVNQIQDRLENIQILRMKCNDLASRPTCEYDESYRQKIVEVRTIVDKSERELKTRLSKTVTAVTSIDLVKQNVEDILKEFKKSTISYENLDKNLSEMRTVINVLDTCVRKIQPVTKDIPFKLPPKENFFGDLREDESRSTTAEQRKQKLRSNIRSLRKPVKEDIDMFILKYSETEKTNIKQSNVERDDDFEHSISVRPSKPSIIRSFKDMIHIALQLPRNVTGDYLYEVSYRCVDDVVWKIFRTETTGIKKSLGPFLKCNTDYVFRVRRNCNGVLGEYSEISDVIKTEYCSCKNCDVWCWFIFTM
ncbi:unnamed protein product [Mytilus coruscus]|uniref:Fibronectin type-III domain-containing protein n=1 Tax=Mytilus coruscus TaxID=42192 RepID=A0A6J8DTX1_MYTCO|nr:unnamed protein product [Mytilus coruscus]